MLETVVIKISIRSGRLLKVPISEVAVGLIIGYHELFATEGRRKLSGRLHFGITCEVSRYHAGNLKMN